MFKTVFARPQKIRTAEQLRNFIQATVKGTDPDSYAVKKKDIKAFLDGTNEEESKKCLEFLEEDLTCPICVEVVTEPTITSCHHAFCKCCLNKWMKDEKNATCPTCRKTIAVPKPSLELDGIVEAIMEKHGRSPRLRQAVADPSAKQQLKKIHKTQSKQFHRKMHAENSANVDLYKLMIGLKI